MVQFVNHLYATNRVTGECYAELVTRSRPIRPCFAETVNNFERLERPVCTDGATAIERAERHLPPPTGVRKKIVKNHIKCRIHRVAKVAKSGPAKIAHADVSGIIAAVLAIKASGGSRDFRNSVRNVLQRRLVVKRGYPSAAATKHRQAFLRLAIPIKRGSPSTRTRFAVVSTLGNGDLTNPTEFEHYCNGCCANPADTARKLRGEYVTAVLKKQLTAFPRHSFNRSSSSLEPFILLQGAGNVMAEAFFDWCVLRKLKPTKPPAAQLAISDEAPGDGGGDDGGGDVGAAVGASADDPGQSYRKELAKHAKNGYDLLVADNASPTRVMILKRILDVQQSLMFRHVQVASADWEMREDCKVKAAEQAGARYQRPYRAQLVATGEMDAQLMAELRSLLVDDKEWDFVPDSEKTAAQCGYACTMATKAAGIAKLGLLAETEMFPMQAYKLAFESAESGDWAHMGRALLALYDLCKFVLGAWGIAFVDKWGRGGILSKDAVIDCVATCISQYTDTLPIERGHATIRRSLRQSSTQTHLLEFQSASEEFVMHTLRSTSKRTLKGMPHAAKPRSADRGRAGNTRTPPSAPALAEEARKVSKAPKGGGMRAYFSEELKKGQKPFGEIHAAYKQLPDDERERLREKGLAATKASAAGNSHPFGSRRKQADADVRKRARADAEQSSRTRLLAYFHAPGGNPKRARLALDDRSATDEDAGDVMAIVPYGASWEHRMQAVQAGIRKDNLARDTLSSSLQQSAVAHAGINGASTTSNAALCAELAAKPFTQNVSSTEVMPGLRLLRMNTATTALEYAENVMALSSTAGIGISLFQQVEKNWEGMHCEVRHERCAPLPDKKEKIPMCNAAGRCVEHTLDGRRAKRLVSQLQAVLRNVCAKSSPCRTSLGTSRVFLCLNGTSQCEGEPSEQLWYNVSHVHFSPYMVAMLPMQSTRPLVDTLHVAALSTTGEGWLNSLEFGFAISKDRVWTLRLFVLLASTAPVAAFIPGRLMVRDMMEGSTWNIWSSFCSASL